VSPGDRPSSRDITVVVADPDPLARRWIIDVLRQADGIEIVGAASTADDAVELVAGQRPDILLTEIALGDLDLRGLVKRLRAESEHEVRIVVFSSAVDDDRAVEALSTGAAGALAKDTPLEAVARALHGVAAGEAALSRQLTMRLIDRVRRAPTNYIGMRPLHSPLTGREWEIVDLLAADASTQQIAETLVLTEATVYTHVKNILRKLHVSSRADAVQAADRLRRQALERNAP
jgi:DNA-binding NarL/FixJ family response regulator